MLTGLGLGRSLCGLAAGIEADSPQAVKATKPATKERPTEATFVAIGFVLLGLRTMSGKPVVRPDNQKIKPYFAKFNTILFVILIACCIFANLLKIG